MAWSGEQSFFSYDYVFLLLTFEIGTTFLTHPVFVEKTEESHSHIVDTL